MLAVLSTYLNHCMRRRTGAVPDTAAVTGLRLAVVARAAAAGPRHVLGTGAKRRLGA